ncbi:MAG TPA: cytochrome c maturation protein CcmE [Ideonella sp.]|uniref:cytochrome c maturation protein CcmE n=1 Tax=Ideonella sp. TaxID=1929293 RepID=UPI002C201F84|nr:cytochrome c maturation protein CcmE [Ideonella sp.]HSI48602.1 cytochrome c maturation protein CcmE [Ideonella sp.]
MSRRQRRFAIWATVLLLAGAAVALALSAFKQNLVFYLTPSELAAKPQSTDVALRIGGYVQPGSLQREADSLAVRFVLADAGHTLAVHYRGVLPDLFAEGKGAIVQGRLAADGSLQAQDVLAKHDENYTPPGLAPASPASAP